MVLDKSLSSGKRFGSRYGRRVRHKFARIEAEQHKAHTCPYCSANKVGRLAVGIWQCKKCNSKFTGKAYTISKKIVIKEEASKEEIAVPEEIEAKEEKAEEEKPQKYKEKRVEQPEEQPELAEEEPKKKAEKKEEKEE